LGGAAEFDGTLVSVLSHRPADCEVLVVHTDRYDDPYDLGDEVGFLLPGCQSLVGLINAGLAQTSGEVVHVLGCGLEATEGWTDAAVTHFEDDDVAAVTPLVLAADSQSIISAGLRFTRGGQRKIVTDRRLLAPGAGRLRASVLGPTLAAGFYRREVLAALDGFDKSLADCVADADTALAIRALGGLHVCEPASRLIQQSDSLAAVSVTGFAAGRSAERIFWRHAGERGLALSLGLHGLTMAASLLQSGATLATLAGRAVACAEFGAAARHQERLAAARQRLEEVAELRATIKLPARSASPAADRRRAA
jgi:hypothetical protein